MKIIPVVAAVIYKEGMVLICKRPDGKPPYGWEFPGGKIEDGETRDEALEREMHEELSLDCTVSAPIFETEVNLNRSTAVRITFLRCIVGAEAIPAPREGQQCRFVRPECLLGYDLLEADRRCARFLMSQIPAATAPSG